MNLMTLTFKNLWTHRLRFFLTVLGVGTSIATFVSLVGLSRNLEDTLKATYQTRGTDLILVEKGLADFLTSAIDEKAAGQIAAIPDVDRVGAILVDFCAVKSKQYLLVYGWGFDSYLFDELKIDGRRMEGPGEALIGSLAARRFNKKAGDTVPLKGKMFKIVGVYKSKSVLEDGGLMVPLSSLQALKKSPGKVTMFYVRVKKDKTRVDAASGARGVIRRVQEEIAAAFPDLEARNIDEFVAAATPVANAFHFTLAISLVAFLVAVLGMLNMMVTSVLERSRDIGILRAIGWRPVKIVAMVIFESVVIGLCGGIVGLSLGYGLMRFLAGMPQLAGLIQITYDDHFMAQVVISAAALGFIAGIYPAARAVSIKPLEVLRYE